MKQTSNQSESSVWLSWPLAFVFGLIGGAVAVLLFLYIPQQRLLLDRERAINEMARFNREEQQRIRDLRDISTSEMLKWIAMTERTNTEFLRIQQRLHDQEKALSNPGWFYITLMLSVTTGVVIFYIWVNRTSDAKDATTLENFETFISAKMLAMELPRDSPPSVLLSDDSVSSARLKTLGS